MNERPTLTVCPDVGEQTAEMRRKSLARQSSPKCSIGPASFQRSISPVKADYAFPSTSSLLPPRTFNRVKEELSESTPTQRNDEDSVRTSAAGIIKLPSPSKSSQRKLPELPTSGGLSIW